MKFSKDKVINYIKAFVGTDDTMESNIAVFRFGDETVAKLFLMDIAGIDYNEVPAPISMGDVWYIVDNGSCKYRITIECDDRITNYKGFVGVYFRFVKGAANPKYLMDNKFARRHYAPDYNLCYDSQIHYVNYNLFCGQQKDEDTAINSIYSGKIKKETPSFKFFSISTLNAKIGDIYEQEKYGPLLANSMRMVIREFNLMECASDYLKSPFKHDDVILAEFVIAYDIITTQTNLGRLYGIQCVDGLGKKKGRAIMDYLYEISDGKFDPEPELRTGGKKE